MARTAFFNMLFVIYGAFKHHIGFYPTTSATKAFAKELSKFKHAKGSVQFTLDQPLPAKLIRKITAFRMKECKQEDAKWRS